MKRISALIMTLIMCLLFVSCDNNKNTVDTEFMLYSDNLKFILNADVSTIKREPATVKSGSGDGFKWNEYDYEDVFVKALISDEENSTCIIKIVTSSPDYKTSKGVKTGDKLEYLKTSYNEILYYGESESKKETVYVYDPADDIGFNRIYFYTEDEIITKIEIENGIDG